jgi:hypothetical protein
MLLGAVERRGALVVGILDVIFAYLSPFSRLARSRLIIFVEWILVTVDFSWAVGLERWERMREAGAEVLMGNGMGIYIVEWELEVEEGALR